MHGLNPPQREAVLHTEGPLLVLAGAGSGKTRVIVEKIAHLIQTNRYPAKRIAAITFTNKSAKEMRERVAKRIKGGAAEGLTVCTFHALGLRLLQIEHARVGLKRGFSVFDTDDVAAQMKDLLAGAKADVVQAMQGLVSRAKNAGLSPEEAIALAQSPRELQAAQLYVKYQQRLNTFNAVDFDDLIRLPVELLERDEECRLGWRERIGYLLVDECQDTNDAQYRLLKALAGETGSLHLRGRRRPEHLRLARREPREPVAAGQGLSVAAHRQAGTELPLQQPRAAHGERADRQQPARAPQDAVEPAGRRRAHPHPRMPRQRARGRAHRQSEIHFINQSRKAEWGEFCILFRGNHQSRPLEKAMQLLRVPYHLSGGTAFLDRGEVKDALAWLRLIANPDDDAAFLRAVQSPKREVGATTLAKLAESGPARGHADGTRRRSR